MDQPIVSILMPTYKPNPVFLREAVDSTLAQTEQRWELIVNDDASGDAAKETITPYLSDERIRYTQNAERKGIGGNWNACLAQARSPYIAYLFQDDRWKPAYLTEALQVLNEHPSVNFVAIDHDYHFEGESQFKNDYAQLAEKRRTEIREGVQSGPEFLRTWISQGLHPNYIGEPSFVVMRKSAMDAVGPFLEDMPQFLDVEYWTRLLSHGDWCYLRKNLGWFRVHPKGASAVNQREGKGLFDRLRCLEGSIALLPDAASKRMARKEMVTVLAGMIRKYKKRKAEGGAISGQGGGAAKQFALRHPWMMLKAIWLASTPSQS